MTTIDNSPSRQAAPEQTESALRKLARSKFAAITVALGAASAVAMWGADKHYERTITRSTERQEFDLEIAMRDGQTLPVDSANVVYREGTVYRHSPELIGKKFFGLLNGNEAGKVPEGQELIIINPLVKMDDKNGTWHEAEIKPAGECMKLDTKSVASVETIGERYVSLNYGALSLQSFDDDRKFAERHPISGNSSDDAAQAAFNNAGQLLTSGTEKIVGCAGLYPAGTYELWQHAAQPVN